MNLARMELRLAIVLFFKTFPRIEIAPEAAADDMTILNYFLIVPKGGRNLIRRVGGKQLAK